MRSAAAFALALTVGLSLDACGRPSNPRERDSNSPRPVTFNRDVAPILFAHCGSCHRPTEPSAGEATVEPAAAAVNPVPSADRVCFGGAPFSVLDYAEVRRYANAIAGATKTRYMPPWPPEPGYGHFLDERRLSSGQIEIIQRWVAEGAGEGDPADRPRQPQWPTGWQLGQPDLVLDLPQTYILQPGSTDVFRNFVIPVPLSSTRYVRAIEFRADNPKVLHHASIGIDPTRVSRLLDRSDPEAGFATMPDNQVQNVFGWTPGKAPFMDPADLAWPLEKGSDLVLQLHMMPTRDTETVRPSVGLFFSDRPPARTRLLVKLESQRIDIPAGQADYVVEDSYVLPADVDVLSVYPHAHYLGKEMKGVARLPNGQTEPLIWIRAWNFKWQDRYRYAVPLFLPKGTTVAMRFTYDNSSQNANNPNRPPRRVKWGVKSSDEMAGLWLEVVPRRADAVEVLMRDEVRRSQDADIAGTEAQVRADPLDASAHNLLASKYLRAGRAAEARAQLEEALRLRPDYPEAHSNLGILLVTQERFADAVAHGRTAARLKPDDDLVHFNLGNALSAAGRMAEAIGEFRRAIRINPANADAHFNLALLLARQNRLDEAIAHLRSVVDINPRNGDAYRDLGVALGLQGKTDEAIAALREALGIRPDSEDVRARLAALLESKRANLAR
jgi:tetratricopeptide (TPR) repeat protein